MRSREGGDHQRNVFQGQLQLERRRITGVGSIQGRGPGGMSAARTRKFRLRREEETDLMKRRTGRQKRRSGRSRAERPPGPVLKRAAKNHPQRFVLKDFQRLQSRPRKLNQGTEEVINYRAYKGEIDSPSHRNGDTRRVVGESPERAEPTLKTIKQVTDDRMGLTSGRESWRDPDWSTQVVVLGGGLTPQKSTVQLILSDQHSVLVILLQQRTHQAELAEKSPRGESVLDGCREAGRG
ncbi:hypothetical protein E2C01_049602 [Portunus trituberculatus]|uniref:Uncharacterized protein n=1 Tax=Portunus trituberculatus TaxID=210409 RepID=A0A5B7G617_PORTR|nr:hypothetical protein [Portunus trituberculatus]